MSIIHDKHYISRSYILGSCLSFLVRCWILIHIMVGRKIETNKFFGLLFDRLSRGRKFKRHDQKEYRSGTILGCFRPFRTIERSLSHFFHILLITYAKSILSNDVMYRYFAIIIWSFCDFINFISRLYSVTIYSLSYLSFRYCNLVRCFSIMLKNEF